MKKLLISAGLILASGITHAQNEISTQEVLVTEKRLNTRTTNASRAMQLITQEEIRNSTAKSVAELLEMVAGVDIRSRGPLGVQSDIQIRGGSFEQTLILINGVRLTDAQTGHHLANLPVNLSDIEAIEILKGSASRAYGQNAYAGVINIITKKPATNELSAGVLKGDFNLNQVNTSLSLKTGKLGQRISYSNTTSDGYKLNTDFTIHQLFYQSVYRQGNSQFELFGGIQNKDFGANGFYTEKYPWQYEETKLGFGTLAFNRPGRISVQSRLSYRHNNDMFELKRDTPSFSQNKHKTDAIYGDLLLSSTNRLGAWSVGIDLRQDKIQSNNLGNRSRQIISGNAEQQLLKLRNFIFAGGLCFNRYSDYGLALYPGLDAAYTRRRITLGGSISKAFRVPTFTELYYTDGGKTSIGNPGLKPEQAWNGEVNFKYNSGIFNAGVSWFRRSGLDQIDWIKDSASAVSWKAVNLGTLTTSGYEALIAIFPSRYYGFKWLRKFQGSWTYIDQSKAKENQISRYTFDYLRNQVIIQVQTVALYDLHSNLRVRYEERVGYKSYWLVDYRISWQRKHYEVFAECSNIFNATWVETGKVSMPGRWFRAGLQVRLNEL